LTYLLNLIATTIKQISRRSFVQNFGLGISATALLSSLVSFAPYTETISEKCNGKKLNIAPCGLGRYATILAESLVLFLFL